MKLAILASGEGTLLQAVIDAYADGHLDIQPVIVISNNKESGALRRAEKAGIHAWHFHPNNYFGSEEILDEVMTQLLRNEVDLILLLGYLKRVGESLLGAFPDKILNIHPSLLPKYGGLGMYDMFVHQAVIDSGDLETGITVHVANHFYDEGRIISQKVILVEPKDTAESLRARVRAAEPEFLIETLKEIEKRGYV